MAEFKDHSRGHERHSDGAGRLDSDYQDWVLRKIRRAMEQAGDPGQMIAADKVWKDLGLEK